jgi:hypothetical protein
MNIMWTLERLNKAEYIAEVKQEFEGRGMKRAMIILRSVMKKI